MKEQQQPGPARTVWQQLAVLTPSLKPGLKANQHNYRGSIWYLIADPSSGQHFRCTDEAYRFLTLLNGHRTVAEAFQEVFSGHGDESTQQTEIVRLFTALHAASLLKGSDTRSDYLHKDPGKVLGMVRRILLRPLAIRFPLLDPDRLLTVLLSLVHPVFSKRLLWAWFTLICWAVWQAAIAWPELAVHWDSRFSDPQNLMTLLLVYPLIKGLHELGHGITTKAWGGEVHEMGIMLLVFVPVPYVDASASNAFSSRNQRLLVGASGIMVEACLAAIAILLWAHLSPGLARDLCFNIAFIGGVSTLLFNGNPLLRYDGYYVLGDFLEIPNLGTRSAQYLGYLLRHYVFGLRSAKSPVTAPGERGWLFTYGLLAGLYRIFISMVIALLVAGQFFVFGVLLALWFLFLQILVPLGRSTFRLIREVTEQGLWLRALGVFLVFTGVATSLLFIKSFESSSYAEGMIVIPRDAPVRTGVTGFVAEVMVKNGQWVKPGELLFRLENPEIRAQLKGIQAQQIELQTRYSHSLSGDRLQADLLKIELQGLQTELSELQRQVNELDIISDTAGQFTLTLATDLTGRYFAKGDVLGYVVDMSQPEATVVITQNQLQRIANATQYIEIRLVSQPGTLLEGQLKQAVPQAIRKLPNQVLGTRGGGRIPVDARDPTGLATIEPVFELNLDLPIRPGGVYLGNRVKVRFIHLPAPLAGRFYDYLQSEFVKRFNF